MQISLPKFRTLCFLGLTSLTIQACYNCTQANTNLNPEAKSWTELSQLGLLQFKNAQQELDTIEMKKLHDSFHCAGEECTGECEYYQIDFINRDQHRFFSIRSFSNYVQFYVYSDQNNTSNRFDEEYTGYLDVNRDTVFSWKYSKVALLDSANNKMVLIEVENPKLNQINISKLYFQKHLGLIAYQNLNKELWYLQ